MSLALRLYQRLPGPARTLASNTWAWYLDWWRYGPRSALLIAQALSCDLWTPQQWQAWQEDQLVRTLRHAAVSVPYYEKQWTARRRRGDRAPPVLLRQPPAARPFESLVRLLDTPASRTLDPTLLMALLMPVMIGAMVGDVVYGAVLLALALWARRRFGGGRIIVRHIAGVDPREGTVDKVRANFVLQVVIAPIEQMLQNQHPNYDLGWRSESPPAPTLGPPFLQCLRDHVNHGVVLEGSVDSSQPVGPQLVAIRQQNLEQTPFALPTLNHARSFDKRSCAGSVVRPIDRGNPE